MLALNRRNMPLQKRYPINPLPARPEVSSQDISDEQVQEVMSALILEGRLSVHNSYGKRHKDYTKSFHDEAEKIIISREAFADIPSEDSLLEDIGVHAVFVGKKGRRGVNNVDKYPENAFYVGFVCQDEFGRGWFFDAISSELSPVSLEPEQFFNESMMGVKGFKDITPVFGEFRILGQRIVGMKGDLILAGQNPPQINEFLQFEASVSSIVNPSFTEELYSALLDTLDFPKDDGKNVFPAYNDWDKREAFNKAMEAIQMSVMSAFRDAGFCAPCPNNGPRNVRCLEAWNKFVNNDTDNTEFWYECSLMESPAFREISTAIRTSFIEHKGALTRAQAEGMFAPLRSKINEVLADDEPSAFGRESMKGDLTDEYYGLVGSIFKPVLCLSLDRTKTPLPVIGEPKKMRHYTLTLPTGRLAIADYFRIPGFREALEELAGEEEGGYNINNADGMNKRAHDYLTKAGIAIVQVSNTSPSAYHDNGTWIMGHVDEDEYYDENGEPIGNGPPEPVWDTCTDLWANTFASPEAIVNVLMHSDHYQNEDDAMNALVKYCEETWGANIVDLGCNTLHVYAPTGFIETKHQDIEIGADIIDDKFRMHSVKYLLSDHVLPVNENLLSDENWEAPVLEQEDINPSI